MTERTGQEPLYTINNVVLPCAAQQKCSDESTVSCAVSRTVETVATPAEPTVVVQVPVEVKSVSLKKRHTSIELFVFLTAFSAYSRL